MIITPGLKALVAGLNHSHFHLLRPVHHCKPFHATARPRYQQRKGALFPPMKNFTMVPCNEKCQSNSSHAAKANLHDASSPTFGARTATGFAMADTPEVSNTASGRDGSYPQCMVWGANTGVGKTLVSAGLVAAALGPGPSHTSTMDVLYLKPLQTGFPDDSDSRFVLAQALRIFNTMKSRGMQEQKTDLEEFQYVDRVDWVSPKVHGGNLSNSLNSGGPANKPWMASKPQSVANSSSAEGPGLLECRTLWAWSEPASPHRTAAQEGGVPPQDTEVVKAVEKALWEFGQQTKVGRQKLEFNGRSGREALGRGGRFALVEQAGGVASPGPSGTLQCDLFRPLRLSGVLVGDSKLGGISATISAFEVLSLRGYDLDAIVLVDSGLANHEPIQAYLRGKVPVVLLPPLPEPAEGAEGEDLLRWFEASSEKFNELLHVLTERHTQRLSRWREMAAKACNTIWWPFTQHGLVQESAVSVIDARCGEDFLIFKERGGGSREGVRVEPQFDACSSWWTQGLSASLQADMAKAVGYAAGRYGHVMFPENVNEPALRLTELLLEGPGAGWASRVFFSDNGSTGIEVALKMGFRTFAKAHGILPGLSAGESPPELKVLALAGSYHGDTLGAMEAQGPSSFNGFLQQPWYTGRGLFLEPPTVGLVKGKWELLLPAGVARPNSSTGGLSWESRDDLFAPARDSSPLREIYETMIREALLAEHERSGNSARVATLIIEPVLHGAGGMVLIDPLYQRVLVRECKKRNIPVIYDEVFAGLYRLGWESAGQSLLETPDIAVYAKLLTGGVVPMAVTLAAPHVFDAFQSSSKLEALLHGHSYTAHAIGCSASVTALELLGSPLTNPNLIPSDSGPPVTGSRLQELWDCQVACELSHRPAVARVMSIGTVFAVELHTTPGTSGYASLAAKKIVQDLRDDGVYTRALGNVVYLMCTPFTSPTRCAQILHSLAKLL